MKRFPSHRFIAVAAGFLGAFLTLTCAAASAAPFGSGETAKSDSLVPVVRQTASAVLGLNQFATSFSVQFPRPTLPGSAIWVVVSAPSHDYPSPFVFQVSDGQNNQYQFVGQKNDFNNGIQSVAHFIALPTKGDAACDASTTCSASGPGETITCTELENGSPASDNYLAIFVVEVTGVGPQGGEPWIDGARYESLPYGHSENIDVDPPAGPKQVTSGPIATWSPVLLLALSVNVDGGASDTGGSGYGGPWAGTDLGWESPLFWKFDGMTPLATFATGVLKPTAGAVAAYFDGSPEPAPSVTNKNEYVTVAIAFPLSDRLSTFEN